MNPAPSSESHSGNRIEGNVSYTHHGWLVYGNIAHAKAKGTDISSGQFNFSPEDLAVIARQYIYLDHDQTWTGSAGASWRWESAPASRFPNTAMQAASTASISPNRCSKRRAGG